MFYAVGQEKLNMRSGITADFISYAKYIPYMVFDNVFFNSISPLSQSGINHSPIFFDNSVKIIIDFKVCKMNCSVEFWKFNIKPTMFC